MNPLKETLVRWFRGHRVLTADQFEALLFMSRSADSPLPAAPTGPTTPRRRRRKMANKHWDVADDKLLIELVKAHKPNRLIAKRLHRSTRAIQNRRFKLRHKAGT